MTYSSNGEVFGARILNTVIIIGAVALLLGAITSPAPKSAQSTVNAQVSEQVLVTAQQS